MEANGKWFLTRLKLSVPKLIFNSRNKILRKHELCCTVWYDLAQFLLSCFREEI